MRRRSILSWLAAGVFVLSGCVGGDAPVVEDAADPMAEPSSPDDETGSIAGVVTDEEGQPVPAVDVALLETLQTAQTDANGSFTLAGVAPGEHKVLFERLGFEALGRLVQVAPGEVSELDVVLSTIAIEEDPYHSSQEYVSHIEFDQERVSYVFILADENHSAICGTCHHMVYLQPGPEQTLAENWWEPSGVPSVNGGIYIWWQYYDPEGDYHNAKEPYANRESRDMADEGDELRDSGADAIPMSVHSGFGMVSFQHRIHTWYTFAYLAPLPDGFTALPPDE